MVNKKMTDELDNLSLKVNATVISLDVQSSIINNLITDAFNLSDKYLNYKQIIEFVSDIDLNLGLTTGFLNKNRPNLFDVDLLELSA
jgi:hypothetical protein